MLISACDPGSADALVLIGELSAALAALTGDGGIASFAAADARSARALFVIARGDGGELLGCGALRPLHGDVAEIKRMYARPGSAGVGAALLAHLETAARALGYRAAWLSTRRVNARAVAFYGKHGYAAIPAYGTYIGRDQSVCLGKALLPAAGSRPGV